MAGNEEQLGSCSDCGATIYPEHLERRVAEHWEGKLLCPFCLREKRSASAMGTAAVGGTAVATAAEPMAVVELEPGDSGAPVEAGIGYDKKPTAVRGAGPKKVSVGQAAEQHLQRALLQGSPNATRCKTFHCKLADGPIAYLCEQINEWVDSDEKIEIKFATSTIGVVEGKHVDPHLILTVFY
jgi:hypothetical protein